MAVLLPAPKELSRLAADDLGLERRMVDFPLLVEKALKNGDGKELPRLVLERGGQGRRCEEPLMLGLHTQA